ncbi:MAG: acyl-CoA dehydrogenase family protein [Pseudomonadales bacterium]|nr:acyl-CoA dehydrogenase family protein [Pseudomonadales bacterium]
MATTLERNQHEQSLISAAEALAPAIRERASEFEQARRLPQDLANAMAEAGLHKIATPIQAGGSECHPITQIEIIETIARADGSAGWNLMIGVEVQGFAAAAFPPEAAKTYFGNPNTIVAGALNPVGRAREVAGGLQVNGVWPMASGCQNADLFWGQCLITEDNAADKTKENDKVKRYPDGSPILREVLIPMQQMEILGNWHANGLRGSGSHDVEANELFVADEKITAVNQQYPQVDSTLFRFPTYSRLAYNKAAVATGIARAAIDYFTILATSKKPRSSKNLLSARHDAQLAIAEAEAALRSGRAFMIEAVNDMWDLIAAGNSAGPEPRALVLLSCINAVQAACDAVDRLYAAGGTNTVYAHSALGRCHRDVHIVPQHVTVSPQWKVATGRMFLGLASDVPVL